MELAKDDNLISGDAWRKGCLRKFSPWPADGCKIDEVYTVVYIYVNIWYMYNYVYIKIFRIDSSVMPCSKPNDNRWVRRMIWMVAVFRMFSDDP